MRASLAGLLLVPALAGAQTLTITATPTPLVKNAGNCGSDQVSATWTTSSTLTNACGQGLQIWLTGSGSCGTAPGNSAGSDGGASSDVVVRQESTTTLSSQTTASFSFNFNQFPTIGPACGTAVDVRNLICAAISTTDSIVVGGTCTVGAITATQVEARYDGLPPGPPGVSLVPLDSALSVRLTATGSDSTDVQSFQVEFAQDPGDGGTPSFQGVGGDIGVANAALTIGSLINGTAYLVRAFSTDEADNRSLASTPVSGTPVQSDGLWARYKREGGAEAGGCAAASGALLPAFAVVAMGFLAWRRSRG